MAGQSPKGGKVFKFAIGVFITTSEALPNSLYTQYGNKLDFSNKVGGQEKDFAHPT
jgi:hypothetical protein